MASSFRYSLIFLFVLMSASRSNALPSSDSLQEQIRDAALRMALDPHLVEAVVTVESNFNSSAQSRAGAMGLMQVMPDTAKQNDIRAPFHAVDNLMGACQYLRKMLNRYQGDVKLALAAYNAGPRNVDKYRGIPPFKETRNYVKRVLSIYNKLKRS